MNATEDLMGVNEPDQLHPVGVFPDAEVCTFARTAFEGSARGHPELEHKRFPHTLTELDRRMIIVHDRDALEACTGAS